MTKQILHAHNYGHQNIGDDAMAENVYMKLAAIEDAKVTTISTYSPPHQSGSDIRSLSGIVNNYSYFIMKIFLVGVHRLKLARVYLVYSWFTCEFCLLIAKIYKAIGLMLLPFGSMKELILRISSADVYLRSGSGSLNDIWFWRSMYPQFTEARLCNLFGVKVYFTGQGLGPFNGAYREKVLEKFLASCEMITFRDCMRSEELVAEVTPNLRNYKTVGDDAFDYPKELLDDDTQSLFDDGSKVLVCQFRPTNYEEILSDEYWKSVATILESFVDTNRKNKVVLVSFSNGRVSDLTVSKKINEYAKNKLIVLDLVYSPGQAKTILAQAYIAIGQSYHFGVFALAEAVPFIALYTNRYYEDKHKGLLGWYAMEKYAIPKEGIEILKFKLEEMTNEIEILKNRIREKNVSIAKNVNTIYSLIENNLN